MYRRLINGHGVSADESGIDIGVGRQLKNLDSKGENRL